MGVPLAWGAWTSVTAKGQYPPYQTLEESKSFPPGLTINLFGSVMWLAGALLLAIVAHAACRWIAIRWRPRFLMGSAGAACLVAIAVAGGMLGSRHDALLMPIFIALLVAINVVAWPAQTYGPAVIGAVIVAPSLWWGLRIGDHWAPQSAIRSLDWEEFAFIGVVIVLLSLLSTLVVAAHRATLAWLKRRAPAGKMLQ